ncbi:hypothetical protein AJ79_05609 [Helicocarpus griseus UAMH5409]|uniref:MARVEL domain-containing protein n=1 Tax=Helicocarpus griseus UAMH5409 TaxID=1447875 RepID=A0A2B7XMK4_9EURO|nr:hypothetical protein AJ79_05609 [Helicocarpus griseus UAMH5409]
MVNARRPISALIALLFTAGSWIFMILTLIGGAQNKNPLDRTWFLEADTSRIPGAHPVSRWTFWGICGTNGEKNDCGGTTAAFPLDPPSHWNFGTTEGVPEGFIGTSTYFYMTRFMFAFMLIGLFFIFLALVTGLLAMCTSIGGWISAFLTVIGLIFQIVTTCLMTAAYVKGRNQFSGNGQPAKVGAKAFGWMWAATVTLFIASILYCVSGIRSGGRRGGAGGGGGGRKRNSGFFKSRGGKRASTNGAGVDKEYA